MRRMPAIGSGLRLGEAWHPACEEMGPQIAPPGQADAGQIEGEEAHEGHRGPAGRMDRGAEAPRNEEAAERTDGRCKADHGCALAPCLSQRLFQSLLAPAL